jgi:hypothetical protein
MGENAAEAVQEQDVAFLPYVHEAAKCVTARTVPAASGIW